MFFSKTAKVQIDLVNPRSTKCQNIVLKFFGLVFVNMNGNRINIEMCNFQLCSYSINYYSYRKSVTYIF